ncbi:hypothetical protein C5167_029354 [Papaver somniferum]|nr:hypothetical protein C5167_029354 [Papaver somniferum]
MLNRNQVISEVAEASIEDYETGMQGCNEAAKIWMQVHGSTSSIYGGPSAPPLATIAPIPLPPTGGYAPVQVML